MTSPAREHCEVVTTGKTAMNTKYYEERAAQIIKSKKAETAAEPGLAKPPNSEPVEDSIPATVVQLPLWPEPMRAAPNVMLRSELFAVVEKGKRKTFKRQLMSSWTGTEIRFTGEQLDQFDQTIWFQAIHLANVQAANQCVARFKLGAFLREIGLSKHGAALKRIDASFTRLIACEVAIKGDEFIYRDNMLGLHIDENTGVYTVRLNPALVRMFSTGFTRIEWQTRRELKTDLAKWLHGFVLSHRADKKHPQRIAVERLRALAGIGVDRELKKFRFDLKRAMRQLQEFRVVLSWRITTSDSLEFVRPKRKEITVQEAL